jgi:hypothetical protein
VKSQASFDVSYYTSRLTDADGGTDQVLRDLVERGATEAMFARALEAIRRNRPHRQAAYFVGTVNRLRKERYGSVAEPDDR